MLEFGLRKGLAVDMGFDRMVEQERYHQQMKRQASIESENRANMLANDFDYNNAMNQWDHEKIKSLSQQKVKELGAFIRENPDYMYDVNKMVEYKMRIKDLKDNKELNEGMLADQNIKAYQAYMQDKANSEIVNGPEFQHYKEKYENYLRTGSMDGIGQNRQLFTFVPPEEAVDYTKEMIAVAGAAQHDRIQRTGYMGSGMKKEVSTDAKLQAANLLLNSKSVGKWIRKDYDKYIKDHSNPDQADSLENWTVKMMNPYFKETDISPGWQPPVDHLASRRSGSGSGRAQTDENFWKKIHYEALKKPDATHYLGAKELQDVFSNIDGEYNLDKSVTPLGDPVNLGTRKGVSTGKIMMRQGANGALYGMHEVKIRLNPQEFAELGDKYAKMIDDNEWFDVGDPESGNTKFQLESDAKKYGIEKKFDKNEKPYVEMTVFQKYDPANSALAMKYGNVMKINHDKEERLDVDQDNERKAKISAFIQSAKEAGYTDEQINEKLKTL